MIPIQLYIYCVIVYLFDATAPAFNWEIFLRWMILESSRQEFKKKVKNLLHRRSIVRLQLCKIRLFASFAPIWAGPTRSTFDSIMLLMKKPVDVLGLTFEEAVAAVRAAGKATPELRTAYRRAFLSNDAAADSVFSTTPLPDSQ